MSEQAKPTPGPWKVGYHALDVMAEDARGPFKICDIRGWGHFTGKGHGALGLQQDQAVAIQAANANLIAAAPDMLEALELIQGFNWQLDDSEHGKEIKRRALAAIAKAEGQSPAPVSGLAGVGE